MLQWWMREDQKWPRVNWYVKQRNVHVFYSINGKNCLTHQQCLLRGYQPGFAQTIKGPNWYRSLPMFRCSGMPRSLWPCGLQHFLVHHHLPEFAQTHVHWVGDAMQPFHPLSSPSPPAFNLTQHQGLFKWVSSSHQVAKVLEFQLQHQSFQWTFRTHL